MKNHNPGIRAEIEFIQAFDGKRYADLNNNLRAFAKAHFDNLVGYRRFKAEKCDAYIKADVKLSFGKITHYISLKSGAACIVHCEQLKTFIPFLRELGFSRRTIITVLLFQFGDGTVDGTGEKRYTYEEFLPMLGNRTAEANKEMNLKEENIRAFFDRVVFTGNQEKAITADIIYHGSVNYGVWATRNQILKHMTRRSYAYMRNLHIGPIQFHPYARYVNRKETHPEKRYWIKFKWVDIIADLDHIGNRYDD